MTPSLDRNFVLAKVCEKSTYLTWIRMPSLFSIMYHLTSILSCRSHPIITVITHTSFDITVFFSVRRSGIIDTGWLVSASCLVSILMIRI